MSWHDVGPAEAVPEGRFRIVPMDGRQIGLTSWRGRLYAVLDICPHQRGPVCSGPLLPPLTAPRPGCMDLDEAAPVISCPWHGWEFWLDTGEAVSGGRYRVRTFPVRVQAGRVMIKLPSREPSAA
jgi:nitrite reductase/ring-hydroxylating ferredoxin subunit